MACERMVSVLATIADDLSQTPEPAIYKWLEGWFKATLRRMQKVYKAYQPGSFKSLEFERHRYPGIAPAELAKRLERFQKMLGDDTKLHLDQIHDKIFKISA